MWLHKHLTLRDPFNKVPKRLPYMLLSIKHKNQEFWFLMVSKHFIGSNRIVININKKTKETSINISTDLATFSFEQTMENKIRLW